MAYCTEVVHFETAATVNIPLTKFSAGDMPKLILALTSNSTDYNSHLSPTLAIGLETSSGGRFSASAAYKDNVTNQAYASGHRDTTTYGLEWGYLSSQTGQTIVARATVTSWTHNQLTLTFSLYPGTPIKLTAKIYGGSSFTVGTPSIKTQDGTTGNKVVTGIGFQPNMLFVVNCSTASSGQTSHGLLGIVDSDGADKCFWGLSNGFGNGVRRFQRDCMMTQRWNGAEYSREEFVSYDADGYTYNVAVGYNGVRTMHLPCRIEPSAGKVKFYTSNYSTTGLMPVTVESGYKPIGLFAFSYCGAASASDLTTGVAAAYGFTDGTTQGGVSFFCQGTYPANSRIGGKTSNTMYLDAYNAYNVSAERHVFSSFSNTQFTTYVPASSTYEVFTLADLIPNSSSSSSSSSNQSSSSSSNQSSSSSSNQSSSSSSNQSSSSSVVSSSSSSIVPSSSSSSSPSSSSSSSPSSSSSSSLTPTEEARQRWNEQQLWCNAACLSFKR